MSDVSMKKPSILVVFFALVLLSLSSRPTLAAEDMPWQQEELPRQPTDDEVNAIAKQLYCPVCENIPLDVCPTLACEQWRGVIRDKLAAGWDEQQIKTYFVNQYGDRVLATPPARGLNWLVYVIPPLVILFGIILLYRAFSAWKKPIEGNATGTGIPATPAQAEDNLDEYAARLEEELRRRQSGSAPLKKGES